MSKLFETFTSKKLMYNACWEDAHVDRQLLKLDNNANVLMISSAGCNALNYLIDRPKKIDCIDINSRQNALLNFKKSVIKHLNFQDFKKLFMLGRHEEFDKIIHSKEIKQELSTQEHQWFTNKAHIFNGKGFYPSFYYYSNSGKLAAIWYLMSFFSKKKKAIVEAMFNAETLEEQQQIFQQEVRPLFWNFIVRGLFKTPIMALLAGVPKSQVLLIEEQLKCDLGTFFIHRVDKLVATVPLKNNYFWRVYALGSYSESSIPAYLEEQHFNQLKADIHRVNTQQNTITEHLKQHDDIYSHIILLDHMDWMYKNPEALNEEWQAILDKTDIGSKILLRTAGNQPWFVADFAKQHFDFSKHQADVERLHKTDRVGTYGATFLGERISKRKSHE